jgi:hypothetical protein
MSDQLKCPKCRQIDMVQKVSTLYDGGISKAQYQAREAVIQTAISKKLAPPSKPTPPSNDDWRLAFFVGAIGLFALFVITPAIVNPNERSQGLMVSLGIVGFAVLLVILAVTTTGKAKRQFESDISKWYRAMKIWNELYYCARDDVVFIPGESHVIPAYQMTSFLWEVDRPLR